MKFCPFCGAGLHDTMIFCPKCGKKFQDAIDNPEIDDDNVNSATSCVEDILKESVPSKQVVDLLNEPQDKEEVAQTPVKKARRPIVLILGCCAIAVVALIGFFAFSKGATPTTEPEAVQEVNIAEIANSVLYLEVYDDANNVTSTASGFVINDGTTLITNYHVIQDAYHIVAWTPDGENSVDISTILAYDEAADIAVLKCDLNIGVPVLTFGDSDSVNQGDTIYAVGYPLGLAHTLSDGVVGSRYTDENNIDTLQITAAISPGSSGGALLNNRGEVIGVICASYVDGQNLNIAVASNVAVDLLNTKNLDAPTEMKEWYISNHVYGISNVNLRAGGCIAESEEYIFYGSPTPNKIYRYTKETGKRTVVAEGCSLNVYNGHLYYVLDNTLYKCDFDGNHQEVMVEGSKETVKVLGLNRWKEEIGSILIAENCIFVSVDDYYDGSTLYVFDLETREILYQIDDVLNFTYFKETLIVSTAYMREHTIELLNMKSFEHTSVESSCIARIIGVDESGSIYYSDHFNGVAAGVFVLDIDSMRESVYNAFPDKSVHDAFVYEDRLYITESSDEYVNHYTMKQTGDIDNWGQQHHSSTYPLFLRDFAGTISDLDYFYLNDGTTLDIFSGEVVGTWVFK